MQFGTDEIWWKVACPLSGSDPRKRTFVQKVGQGGEGPISGGKWKGRFRAAIARKQTLVNVPGQGSNARAWWIAAGPLLNGDDKKATDVPCVGKGFALSID